jgi:hypothetical protein
MDRVEPGKFGALLKGAPILLKKIAFPTIIFNNYNVCAIISRN